MSEQETNYTHWLENEADSWNTYQRLCPKCHSTPKWRGPWTSCNKQVYADESHETWQWGIVGRQRPCFCDACTFFWWERQGVDPNDTLGLGGTSE